MGEAIGSRLEEAIKLLRTWMLGASGSGNVGQDPRSRFWPQEQTLQDWFAAALVRAGYCAGPTHVLAEIALGENEVVSATVRAGIGGESSTCFLYDLVVLHGPAIGMSRSFETVQDPGPGAKLFVQIKSLNSAGTMGRNQLVSDLRSLWVARRHSEERGCTADTLFLVLATSSKDAKDIEQVRRRVRWLADRFVEFTGDGAAADVPSGVPFALVLADGVPALGINSVDIRRTTGTWTPQPK